MKLTSSYINMDISSISGLNVDVSQSNKTVVMPKDYFLSEKVANEISYSKLKVCETLKEGVDMVNDGKADIIFLPTYCANAILNSDAYNHIKTMSCPDLRYQLSIAVSEDSDELLYSIINKAVNSLSESEINACTLESTLIENESMGLRQLILRYPVVFFLCGLVILFILGMIAWWIYRVRKKTKKQLEVNNQRLQLALSKSQVLVWDYNLEKKWLELVEEGTRRNLHRKKIENIPDKLINDKIVHERSAANCIRLYENVKKGKADNTEELYIMDKNGKYEWYRVSFVPVEFRKDQVIKAIGVGECIQQQKVAEELYQDARIYYRHEKEAVVANFKFDLSSNQLLGWEERNFIDYKRGTSLEQVAEHFLPYVVQPERAKEVQGLFRAKKLLAKYSAGTQVLSKEFQYRYKDTISWINVDVQMLKETPESSVLAFITFQNVGKQRMDALNKEMIRQSMQTAIDENYIFGAAINIEEGTYQFLQSISYRNIPIEGRIDEMLDLVKEVQFKYRWSIGEYIIHPEKIPQDLDEKKQIVIEEQIHAPGYENMIWSEQIIRQIHINEGELEENVVYLIIVRDIQNQKRAEEELRKALDVAKRAVEAKQKFLSNMSHEMRTPLNGIKGILEIMKQNPKENTPKHLDDVINSANHLSSLINDILDMSKIDSGKMDLKKDIILEDAVSDYAEKLMMPLAKEKGLAFQVYKENNLVNGIIGDEKRIRQILTNLLSNAIKYTNQGGQVTFTRIAKKQNEKELALTYIVEDTGIGMSEDFLQRAIRPYEQESRINNIEGTGLGLVITKQLIDLMNGTMEIESKVNQGTKISVHLVFPISNSSAKELEKTDNKIKQKNYKGKKVLIVEDNELNLEIAKIQVESFGLEYDCATNGKAAVELFDASKEGEYNLILMDVMMPIMDGIEATKQIRTKNRKDAKTISIVAMTANAFAEDVHRTQEIGMNFHLSKPFDREDMAGIFYQCFADFK